MGVRRGEMLGAGVCVSASLSYTGDQAEGALDDKEALSILTKPGGILSGVDILGELMGGEMDMQAIMDDGMGSFGAVAKDDKEDPKKDDPKKDAKGRKNKGKDNKDEEKQPGEEDPSEPPQAVAETPLGRASKLGKSLIKDSSEARATGKQLESLGVYAELATTLLNNGQEMETLYGELTAFVSTGVDDAEKFEKLEKRVDTIRSAYKDDLLLARGAINAKGRLLKAKQEATAALAAAAAENYNQDTSHYLGVRSHVWASLCASILQTSVRRYSLHQVCR